VDDYGRHESRIPGSNAPPTPLPEPSGDLLIFHLDAPGTKFAARPSGTEPKIKFYLFARTDTAGLSEEDSVDPAKLETSRRLEQMAEDIHKYIAAKVPEEGA
jgi:phosphoglucomutase/phosphomannomutase